MTSAVERPRAAASSVMQLLKRETRAHHVRAERTLAALLELPAPSAVSYGRTLSRLAAWYGPLEDVLATCPPLTIEASLVWPDRSKTAALIADLATLDLHAESPCLALPTIDSLSQAMGCMYVLEGATLGGQIVARLAMKRVAVTPERGARFFSSYGEHVGSMWRDFSRVLDAYVESAADDLTRRRVSSEMVASAQATFDSLTQWLATAPTSFLSFQSPE